MGGTCGVCWVGGTCRLARTGRNAHEHLVATARFIIHKQTPPHHHRTMPPKRAVTASGDSQRKKRKTNETAAAPRMHPTVYDAVASRINYEGFIKASFQNEFKESRVRSGVMRPADEVLGRRRRAPEGIAPGGDNVLQKLPDHELLLAIHQYAADFYCANGMGPVSTRSMDETALIAIGMCWTYCRCY